MLHKVFTVHDSPAAAFLPPFYFATVGMAIRAFTDSVNDPGHQFAKHPNDYTLFALGTYDDSNGQFDLMATPEPIGKAVEFMGDKPNPMALIQEASNG